MCIHVNALVMNTQLLSDLITQNTIGSITDDLNRICKDRDMHMISCNAETLFSNGVTSVLGDMTGSFPY